MLRCDRATTNLICIVDGDNKLFVTTRNFVEMSKFAQRLCVQFKSKHKLRNYDHLSRRKRIADIHNELKTHLKPVDYIFGIEDDTIFPDYALERLLRDYGLYPFAGFIEGVQLGRWGIPHVGAWKADDIYEPTLIESIPQSRDHDQQVKEIDAGGFYCFMTPFDNYKSHNFKPFDGDGFGPDVDYGMELRRTGMMNYIDWSITTAHKVGDKELTLLNTEPRVTKFRKKDGRWRQSQL